jgi:protein ImuB
MRRIACIHWTAAAGKSPTERGELQIVERCGQFSPIVGFDPADRRSVFLDISGLAHLFGGEAALAEAIVGDLTQFGYTVRLAVADTLGAAWAAVHYCKMKNAKCKMQNERSLVPTLHVGTRCEQCSALAGSIQIAETAGFAHRVCEPEPEPICTFHFSFCILQSFAILHPLPIETLRLPPETVRLLHELGLVRIGQLEALPREEFLSRFGPVLLQRLDQAFGRLDEPVPACPLPPRFEAGWSAEHPTVRRETIAAAVEWLIARVATMLARCGRGALRLDCRVFLENNNQQSTINNLPFAEGDSPIFAGAKIGTVPHLSLSVGLFQPTADAKRLFALLQLQLERLRIGSPVTAVEAAATLSAPLEPRKQAMLFDLDGDLCRPRRLAALVERLCSRLGSRAVVGVRLRPEAQPELSWHYDPLVGRQRRRMPTDCRRRLPMPMQRCKDRKSATGVACYSSNCLPELPPRPLRLLPRPLAAAVTWISPGGPPLRFQFDGCEHEIARSWGPERIETGWWRGRAVGRDYFRVETAAGGHFWLFRRLRDGKWFLHGMFE